MDTLIHVYTTDKGYKLYTSSMQKILDAYAKEKLSKFHQVYIAESPKGIKEYVLVDHFGNVIYSSTKAEDVGCHIDMLRLTEQYKREGE